MQAPQRRRPTRVVMPLECDESTWAAMEVAAALAKALRAELKATFMEDLDVLAAASLPTTRSISYRSGQVRRLDPAQVEAHYRALAARAQRRLAELGRQHALAWSFEVAERAPTKPTPEEEPHPDLVLLDRRALRRRQNAAALLQLARQYSTVGVWDLTALKPSRLILVYRGEAEGLSVAGELAASLGIPLDVVIPDTDGKPGEPLADTVRDWLHEHRLAGSVHEFLPKDPADETGLLALTDTPGALVLFDRQDLIRILGGKAGAV